MEDQSRSALEEGHSFERGDPQDTFCLKQRNSDQTLLEPKPNAGLGPGPRPRPGPGVAAAQNHHTRKCEGSQLEDFMSHLEKQAPEFSARRTVWPWQRRSLWAACAALTLACLINPATTMAIIFAALAIPFLCVAGLRMIAIWYLVGKNPAKEISARALAQVSEEHIPQYQQTAKTQLTKEELPAYAILVPLFKEAHVVPGLLEALRHIDYPKDRLQISFITESLDKETTAALRAAGLDDHMRVVIVPKGRPRTKPRALNYALKSARGDIVVVFDAEDVPEPGQLRTAVKLLHQSGERTGCIQARLNVYNPDENWFTRQFTIEYTGLFDAILPALERLAVPVPLGGTSNHFPRQVLERVGAWDPFNVTEDADLGIRLSRYGYNVAVLPSTTWEEAPEKFNVWFGQRTRWMKGWMQTYLVHMREPARTRKELGLRGFLGFQALMVGLILAPLVHPIFYIALILEHFSGDSLLANTASQPTAAFSWFFWIGFINLVIGYISAIILGAISVARRGWRTLIFHTLAMPLYWLLISFAAYRALIELVSAPHYWEKTDHAIIRDWTIPITDEAREKTNVHVDL